MILIKQSEYMTAQKKILLDFLKLHNDRHYTIDELTNGLNIAGYTIGRSTVYRQISNLVQTDQVLRFEIPGSKNFVYQYSGETDSCNDHFHLKCMKCGKFIHMECPMLTEVQQHIIEEHGFVIGGRSIIYGECLECKEKSKK